MVDLIQFYTRHHARLRKHLPDGLLGPGPDGRFFMEPGFELQDAETSIFLEHAARRVVEERWLELGVERSCCHVGWTIDGFALELDTLFPEETK